MKLSISLKEATVLQEWLAAMANDKKKKKLKYKEEFYKDGKSRAELNKIDYDLTKVYSIINKLDKARYDEEVATGLSKPQLR